MAADLGSFWLIAFTDATAQIKQLLPRSVWARSQPIWPMSGTHPAGTLLIQTRAAPGSRAKSVPADAQAVGRGDSPRVVNPSVSNYERWHRRAWKPRLPDLLLSELPLFSSASAGFNTKELQLKDPCSRTASFQRLGWEAKGLPIKMEKTQGDACAAPVTWWIGCQAQAEVPPFTPPPLPPVACP